MKNVNPVTKRIVGGSSFTDSIIRTNANTEEYVKYVLSVASRELFKNEVLLECICDMFSVTAMCDGRELFAITNEDLEKFRQVEVLAFDKFLLEMIKFRGFSIYEDSGYYSKIRP